MNLKILFPGLDETVEAIVDVSTADVALIGGGVLWVVLLAISLAGIDRRDTVTGFTYVLYMMAAGATLILALPGKHEVLADDRRQLVLVGAMGAVAGVRWLRRAKVKAKEATK